MMTVQRMNQRKCKKLFWNIFKNLNENTAQANDESQTAPQKVGYWGGHRKIPKFWWSGKRLTYTYIIWLISSDFYDRLKFHIFAWLDLNPNYAPAVSSKPSGEMIDQIIQEPLKLWTEFYSELSPIQRPRASIFTTVI